jgi:hypothetical protein
VVVLSEVGDDACARVLGGGGVRAVPSEGSAGSAPNKGPEEQGKGQDGTHGNLLREQKLSHMNYTFNIRKVKLL